MDPTQRLPHLALACALSLGAAVSLGITRFAYGLLLPPMRADLHWSYTLAGAMNTLGQLGGAVAPAVIGYILKWTNYHWATAFYVSAAIYCCGILCWSFLDPVTPLDPERTNR